MKWKYQKGIRRIRRKGQNKDKLSNRYDSLSFKKKKKQQNRYIRLCKNEIERVTKEGKESALPLKQQKLLGSGGHANKRAITWKR